MQKFIQAARTNTSNILQYIKYIKYIAIYKLLCKRLYKLHARTHQMFCNISNTSNILQCISFCAKGYTSCAHEHIKYSFAIVFVFCLLLQRSPRANILQMPVRHKNSFVSFNPIYSGECCSTMSPCDHVMYPCKIIFKYNIYATQAREKLCNAQKKLIDPSLAFRFLKCYQFSMNL